MPSRRWTALALSVPLALAVPVAMPAAANAKAPRVFANCTDVHTVYKGGIARAGAKDHRANGGHARYKPYVNTALFNANKRMDRDKDGIACER
jgi:hypothetical protein